MTIEIYIARDEDDFLGMYRNLTALISEGPGKGDWDGDYIGHLPTEAFPEVIFENSPQKAEIKLC